MKWPGIKGNRASSKGSTQDHWLPEADQPILKLSGVSKHFTVGPVRTSIFHNIHLQVNAGDMVSIMGASGSGKSTLMNIMGLLDRPSGGSIALGGQNIASMDDNALSALRNRGLGFVFQSFFLLPRLCAWENVALPLAYRGAHGVEVREQAEDMLSKVGLAERLAHRPTELSGGQQQRVAIARALVGSPALLLADEPTGALDAETSREIMDLFERLNSDEKATLVLITHDYAIARRCERHLRLVDGEIEE